LLPRGDERLEERWRALKLGGPQSVQMADQLLVM
jgi:hypothetical protein